MLLALDVGNTNITAGLFSGKRLARQWRIATNPRASVLSLSRALKRGAGSLRVGEAVYGSVVPELDRALERAVLSRFGVRALAVNPRSRLGMKLKVKTPGEVGADRIVNAVAAYERVGGAAVVIDFGTATTFDCVSKRGDYLGGAILPGPNLAANALHEHTAKLPRVAVRRPRRVVGRDTVECIQAGIYFGYLGMIEKVLQWTVMEMRGEGPISVLATGGLSALFKRELPGRARLVPHLTLEGLRIAHERLAGGRA
ncbi:MAG: type III pantothenate kinase [Elusimicrobia bacterium]|nr:type III pantothenate kinase [Elusimicrobiota bacterium]